MRIQRHIDLNSDDLIMNGNRCCESSECRGLLRTDFQQIELENTHKWDSQRYHMVQYKWIEYYWWTMVRSVVSLYDSYKGCRAHNEKGLMRHCDQSPIFATLTLWDMYRPDGYLPIWVVQEYGIELVLLKKRISQDLPHSNLRRVNAITLGNPQPS